MSADSSDSNHSSNCTEEVFKESTWNIILSCFFAFFESRRQGDVMNAVEEVLEVVKTLIPN
ncbi:hypothetical protein ENUP19_0345G0001 [Entamoeba nuttalli]|uniref:Uncharacterized protein n=1 Tax=Entamoeba nuttalli TaxID=412467 RepID=A0ABQ0DXK2_9EUKA